MSFTYAELKTAIQDFTENNEPSFVRNIPLFIRQAEERILKNVQLDLFRQNSTALMRAGNQYLEVPNDFLAPFSLSTKEIPWKYSTIPGNIDAYDAVYGILRSYAQTPPYLDEWRTAEAVPGRSLGDITGSGVVPDLADALALGYYIDYKAGIRSTPGTADVPYIEDSLIPYMVANLSTYGKYYDVNVLSGISYLDYKDVSFVRDYQNDTDARGAPRYYAQFNEDNFVLAPTPNNNYSVQLSYFYRPLSLTAGAESGTTWLSKNAEMAMLYGSLIEAGVYMKEEPDIMQMYQSRFQESLMGIKMLGEAKQTTDEYRVGKVVRQKQ